MRRPSVMPATPRRRKGLSHHGKRYFTITLSLESSPMRKTILLLAFAAATALAQQQDFSKVEIKVTRVAGTVYMLQGSGGNIGVSVGDDGIVIVDDEFAPLAPKIRAALATITSNRSNSFSTRTTTAITPAGTSNSAKTGRSSP